MIQDTNKEQVKKILNILEEQITKTVLEKAVKTGETSKEVRKQLAEQNGYSSWNSLQTHLGKCKNKGDIYMSTLLKFAGIVDGKYYAKLLKKIN